MSKLTKLSWEEAEDFCSYLVRAGYRVYIDMDRVPDGVIYKMSVLDLNGCPLVETQVDYDIDVSTLMIRCLDDYATTNDGKLMVDLWRQ